MDQRRLLKTFGRKLPEVHAHHMTLWHFQDGGEPDLTTLPLGKTVPLKVIGYVEDDQAQVALVQPPAKLRPRGRLPHVTITTAAGVKPAYSNDLIRQFNLSEDAQPGLPTIKGKVGWWDGSTERVRFELP